MRARAWASGAMAPCEVELLACGPCEYITGAEAVGKSVRKKRPAVGLDECGPAGVLSKSKFSGHAVPYKKRKLKKHVQFSPASHFRIVECGDSSDDGSDDKEALCSSGTGAACPDHAGCADEVGAASPLRAACDICDSEGISLPAVRPVLREQKIVTKHGDGPSTIGLICNNLIMGLVDRSINNVDTALGAMRAVIHKSTGHADGTAAGSDEGADSAADDEGDSLIDEDTFEAVLERLQRLVEHLDRHDKVGLLPSTARLGKPFIPALKCLQGTLRLAAKEQGVACYKTEDTEDEAGGNADEEVQVATTNTPDSSDM